MANRTLGPWRSWALVVGGAIGSAVFMMPAILVPFGGLGLLSLAAAGIGASGSSAATRTARP